MDPSNRQNEILEKLARIRKELARKERKLQKLKRLSTQKKEQDSLQNESIGSDETRLSSSADVCSPLRTPLETTLRESEVCHSKSQRAAKNIEERSLFSRLADSTVQAENCDSRERRLQTRRSSSSVCTPNSASDRDTAPSDELSRLEMTIASPRRKSSRLESLSGRAKSQRESVTQPSIENIDTANFSDPFQADSHLSVPENYLDGPQDVCTVASENKAAECNPDPKACSCKVSMQTNASLNTSRLNNAAFLDMLLQDSEPEVKDLNSAASVRSLQQDKVTLSAERSCGAGELQLLQGEKARCGVTLNALPQQDVNRPKQSVGLSLVKWTKEDIHEQSSCKRTDSLAKCETNTVTEDKLHIEVLNTCDDDSRDSQQEMFAQEDEPDLNTDDAFLQVMAEDKDVTDKPPVLSASHSPVRKRRRTRSHEPTAMLADTKDTNYNFRKRKLSYSPFWKKRMSRESKTIAWAFSKLIQGVLETPVSMFELNFEQFGLVECAKVKGLPTDPDSGGHHEQSGFTADSRASLESCPRNSETSSPMEPNKRASAVNQGESGTLENFESCALASRTAVFLAENVPKPQQKSGRRSSRRPRQSSTVAEGNTSESSTNNTTSVADKHYTTRKEKMSSPLAVCQTVASTAPASNGNSDSVSRASLSLSYGDHTAQASQRGETQRNSSQSQTGTSCVPPHIARSSCEVPTTISSSSACSDGGSCQQDRQSSELQRASQVALSPSSHSVTRCDKMNDSGKLENMLSDKSSEDATDECDHTIPAAPKSKHLTCLDLQGSSELMERTPPLPSHLARRRGQLFCQEVEDTDTDASTASCGEVVEYFPQDDCDVQGGGQVSELDCVTSGASSAHGALFSQSEESESAEDIKDFVSGIVKRLGVANGSLLGPPSKGAEDPKEESETPDELSLPETFIGASGASLGNQSAPTRRTDQRTARTKPRDALPEPRSDAESVQGESTTLLASLEAGNSVSSAKEQSSDSPMPAPEPPPCGLAVECRSESEKKDVDSHPIPGLICPPVPTEESELRCTVSKRPVAKRLFAEPTANTRLAAVANSEPHELMDPCELEGMFDEWSEECNLDGAAVKKDSRSGTLALKDGHPGDKTSAGSRSNTESQPSNGVDGSRIKAVEKGPSASTEKDTSTEHDSRSSNQGSRNQSPARTDLPADPFVESAVEVTAVDEDQCSQSLSSSLQPLSGLSNFTEEEVDDGELAACGKSERQSEPQDIGSPVHCASRSDDSWCDEDGDGADQDRADAVAEGHGRTAFLDHNFVLGTKRPLLFSYALKCATKEPVTRMFAVRATPRPFLVSVQAGAVNVWHLEETWRHTLVVGDIKFPVEVAGGPECVLLLRCGPWSVLVYLSPLRVPLQLPCLLWDTRDGRHCCQLLLTLGEQGPAAAQEEDSPSSTAKEGGLCIYRLAQLSGRGEGRFASALKTASGTTLLRIHQVRCLRGEFGDETEFLGRASHLLDSLVPVKGLPDALLGNHANLFYVWDCENRVLVKKMVHEPDLFADMRHISWCCSDGGLLFALMRSSDDVSSTLVAVNPFSCKAEPVCSAPWKPAAQARVGNSRPCGVQVEGRYVACISPGYGVRIWNLFTGNPVADMRYQSSTSCAVAQFTDSAVVAVGSDDGRVLVFTS